MTRDVGTRITLSRHTPVEGEGELVRQHRRLAEVIACDYYLPGSTPEDVRQEAMIGLLVAVREHNPDRGPFGPYASHCINAWLMSCITGANRQKHQLLNDARGDVWIEGEEGGRLSLIDTVEAVNTDPVDLIHNLDRLRQAAVVVAAMSRLERHALTGVLNGYEYTELGSFKSIDNALLRARTKLRRAA